MALYAFVIVRLSRRDLVWMEFSERTGKQPYYISAANGSVLSMAGLSDQWTDIDTGVRVRSCTITVTSANALTRAMHDRMPRCSSSRRTSDHG